MGWMHLKVGQQSNEADISRTYRMGDHQEQADDLHPSLVLLDVITRKIYPVVVVTGFGYYIASVINHFGFYDFIRIFGSMAKGLLTCQYNKNPNPDPNAWHTFKHEDFPFSSLNNCTHESKEFNGYLQEQQPTTLSPRRLASLTYSGTPDPKGLKDIVETLPSGLDSSAADSIMPEFAQFWIFE